MKEWYRASRVAGPLAGLAAGFGEWLRAEGFSASTVSQRMCQFDRLSCWLEREGLSAAGLTELRAQQFVEVDRASRAGFAKSARTLRLPLTYLRGAGVAPPPAPDLAPGPVDALLSGFGDYLVSERGLAAKSVREYRRVVGPFLAELQRSRVVLQRLSARDVTSFLARECPRRGVSEARQLTKALRALLRYLYVVGLIETRLECAVPGVADQRGQSLPRGLAPAAVAALLASCDRERLVGVRDYAVLLVLARLGLRAGEVSAMQLEDLDWHAGELLIRGKGRRRERLPLPVDVGEALVAYLRRRSRAVSRAVFLCQRAPRGPLGPTAVSAIVRAACQRAGLPLVCAHRLRHTAATEMLRAGGSLGEVAQVLRHQSLQTTAVYAKVDYHRLRELARPWSGSVR